MAFIDKKISKTVLDNLKDKVYYFYNYYQSQVPAPPLKGPTMSSVIHPP